jgi:hypothetical protein
VLSKQEEEQERRETLENDRLVREAEHRRILREGTTFHQHAQSAANDMAGGRFAAVNPTTVVGAQPLPTYPPLPSSSPWSGAQPEPGPEKPLGYEISKLTPHELEPSMASSSVEDTGAPAGATLSPEPSDAGASLSSSHQLGDSAAALDPAPYQSVRSERAGSPSNRDE